MTALIWGVLLLGGVIALAYPAFFAASGLAASVDDRGPRHDRRRDLLHDHQPELSFSGPERLTPQPIDEVIQRMREEAPPAGN
ncbi:MAG: hypothetical protein R3D30_09825 [Hyphomicrobiales bacterium]